MTNTCALSRNTAQYIEQYRCILKDMMESMTAVTLTDSISGGFIEQMIPHHRAAIAMSQNLLRYTTYIPLQNIALDIVSSQGKSIDSLMAAFPACRCLLDTPADLAAYREKNARILKTMFQDMQGARADNRIDCNFMREMIPHHQGAVRMSENALCLPLCGELIPQLQSIIRSQKEGVRQMQRLLTTLCRR